MNDDFQINPPLRRITYLGKDLAGFEPAVNRSFYTLDPGVRFLWMIGRGISWTILLCLLLFLAFISKITQGSATTWLIRAFIGALPLAAMSLVWPLLAYKHWGLAIRDHDVMIRYGVLFKRVMTVPFSRIQHVDTHSGPIERSMGLSTLIIHTAGAQLSSLSVPGLPIEEAEQLRDYLSKMGHTHANL